MERTVWIIAGEESGDNYGAMLATSLRGLTPAVTVRGMGGEAMQRAGVDIMVDSSELGIVGFVEVVKHLPMFLRLFKGLVKRAAEERPDAVVLIDYPGFNLRFARRLHELGIPVVYYVSPQVWAWGKRRIPEIARLVTKLLVIFPFEPEVYTGTGLDVEFVGHPLLEIIPSPEEAAETREPNTVLILPGSRVSEVDRLLSSLIGTATKLAAKRPELRFIIASPRERIAEHIRGRLARLLPESQQSLFQIDVGHTREWLRRASAGIAASGTVTIEAAISRLPLVVVYRLHWLTYFMAKRLVDIPFFTMVNLVSQARVFDEFLQADVNPDVLGPALESILPGGSRRAEVEAGIERTVELLGGRERASERAAQAVLDVIADRAAQND